MKPEQAWYRHFWPWFLIGLLSCSVIGGITTFAIALSNPDPLVVSSDRYRAIRDEMKAVRADQPPKPDTADDDAGP